MNKFEEKKFTFNISDELNLIYCGKRVHSINHSYETYSQNRYIITLVTDGKALIHFNGNSINIEKNFLYVMFPKSGMSYHCYSNIPWSIKWIVIDGNAIGRYLDMLSITPDKPYVKLNSPDDIEIIFDRLFASVDMQSNYSKIRCISDIHLLFSYLAKNICPYPTQNTYIIKALEYIEQYFSKNINVDTVASYIGISYSYFSALFKSELGYTPISYINSLKVDKAKKLLLYTDKSIKEIASDVGYSDEFYFSRIFKKSTGISPTTFKAKASHTLYI